MEKTITVAGSKFKHANVQQNTQTLIKNGEIYEFHRHIAMMLGTLATDNIHNTCGTYRLIIKLRLRGSCLSLRYFYDVIAICL